MSAEPSVVAHVSCRFNSPASRVFDAWLDPTSAGRWLFATPTGEIVRAEIVAHVGGSWVITDRRDGEDVEHAGTYLEIDRPRRLVFTLSVAKYAPDFDRVTVEISPRRPGCELTLTHELGPGTAAFVERAVDGWRGILEALGALLAEAGRPAATS